MKTTIQTTVKGIVFAMLIMTLFSSCCISGYCQTSPDLQKENETKSNTK